MPTTSMPLSTSAPGSLMLLGEHAVLHGRQAVVAAVARRVRVRLAPREDDEIHVQSALGEFVTRRTQLGAHAPLRFVLGAIEERAASLPAGFELAIESDNSEKIGFGSSAAVTVATLAALHVWTTGAFRVEDVLRDGLRVVRRVQGVGSGADIAASTYGGIVAYRAQPLEVRRLAAAHPFVAVYSGSKMPTPDVIRFVESRRSVHPGLFERAYDLIGDCAVAAVQAIDRGDWATLGVMMNLNHGLMDAIGVSNQALSSIVYALRAEPGVLGSKISGSGLGDCAIGLGTVTRQGFPYPVMPVEVAQQGVVIEAH